MKPKKKKQEETYSITPKGFIEYSISDSKSIWDDLELYCYRHGYNAILINKDGGEFIKVEIENEKN